MYALYSDVPTFRSCAMGVTDRGAVGRAPSFLMARQSIPVCCSHRRSMAKQFTRWNILRKTANCLPFKQLSWMRVWCSAVTAHRRCCWPQNSCSKKRHSPPESKSSLPFLESFVVAPVMNNILRPWIWPVVGSKIRSLWPQRVPSFGITSAWWARPSERSMVPDSCAETGRLWKTWCNRGPVI
ncbi:MAG: hypothetical protein ACD_62C00482G0001 [uncultured bacterium]|nr:MAG: hypothetical protein ACD_62C00482G0001 [uncultured bacterium]